MDNVDSSMRALILKVRSRLKLRTRICALTFPLLYQLHFFRQRWAILRLKDKVRRGGKIRVAFLSMYATSNQDVGVFDLMLKDNAFFDPYIIVNPDVARSYENARFNYDRTRKIFVAKYGRERVLDGVSETGEFIDYSRMFDLMTTSNPYDDMAGGTFKVKYWAGRNVPVFYTSYFYMGRCLPTIFNLKMQNFSLFWKFYAENEFVIQLARKYQFCRGANCVLVGSPKLDNYHRIVPNRHDRKLVLVCPHHSVGDVFPRGGGFLEYADSLIKLFCNYQQIDFVFRPHPLLRENLNKEDCWGAAKTGRYWEELEKMSNVIISSQGDYLQEFADSDAMMHDCGSFAAEYLITGKPCAYFLRSDLDQEHLFTDLGRKCVSSHYPVSSYESMVTFIEKVVLAENDSMKAARDKFAKEKLMYNYPHASEAIVADIKQSLGRA